MRLNNTPEQWDLVPNDFSDPEGTALKGIEAVERFYHAIGMPVNIKELSAVATTPPPVVV